MNATRTLYDLAYGSYRCFKKCNATYETPCTSKKTLSGVIMLVDFIIN
jgi:hypothetical protein